MLQNSVEKINNTHNTLCCCDGFTSRAVADEALQRNDCLQSGRYDDFRVEHARLHRRLLHNEKHQRVSNAQLVSDVLREFRVFFRRFVFWISLTTRWIHIDDIERDGDFEVHRFILHRVLRHGFGRRKRALCGRDILRRRVDPSPVIHHHLLFLAPPRDDGVFRRGAD